jgi:lysozyme
MTMLISSAGIERLKRREGVVREMYRDSAGLPTIGVGHLLTKDELSSGKLYLESGAVDWAGGLTDEQVDELLREDLATSEAALDATLLTVPELEQHQYDALVSFVFNVGARAFRDSTLLKRLKSGNLDVVPDQLRRWVFAGGQVDPILVKRREDEVAQWRNA